MSLDGTRYVGQWSVGLRHGEGVETISAGGCSENGSGLRRGKRHLGGTSYSGQWNYGLKAGNGCVSIDTVGASMSGIWRSGKMQAVTAVKTSPASNGGPALSGPLSSVHYSVGAERVALESC